MNTVKGYCTTCQQLTPQSPTTTGHSCQVCFTIMPFEHAVADFPAGELAAFWQGKYYEARNTISVPAGVAYCAIGGGPVNVFYTAQQPEVVMAADTCSPHATASNFKTLNSKL